MTDIISLADGIDGTELFIVGAGVAVVASTVGFSFGFIGLEQWVAVTGVLSPVIAWIINRKVNSTPVCNKLDCQLRDPPLSSQQVK